MSVSILAQMALLLMMGQVVLGAIAYGFAAAGVPWLGLPFIPLMLWVMRRTAVVLRQDMTKAERRRIHLIRERVPLFVGLLWQLPGLIFLLPGLPDWAPSIWQGVLLSLPGTLGLISPAAAPPVTMAVLWVGWLAEVALFMWLVLRKEQVKLVTEIAPVRQAVGDWAPAMSLTEVAKRRGRMPTRDRKENVPEEE